ncbi:FAD/NAD(P)-binding domain-containing protein [Rickenella mellea]|uniref:FAD/NAD(P)-binding domain-containing protein n=1 Tax=Rickenella mellea TaxID=50990 RepID=A0A4Y7PMG6_9AGAM|nr:FAD/NAD(P)-binding domain-containing protein [Rickenella mellea]
MTLKVIVVGAGIGGCSAALFLDKIGLDVKLYEAYPSSRDSVLGGGIGLASNGTSTLVLVSRELADDIYSRGHKAAYYEMRDCDGAILGNFAAGREGRYGDYGTVLIRRWDVHDAILREIDRKGLSIAYRKRVVAIEEHKDHVSVSFDDGTTDEADLIVGADGIHSVVRRYVAPSAKEKFSGLVGVGGFIDTKAFDSALVEQLFPSSTPALSSKGAIMTFGPLGFFGLAPNNDKPRDNGGSWMWWSTFEAPERDRDEWRKFNHEESIKELLRRHEKWHEPIPELLTKIDTSQVVPNYDLVGIDKYHTRRIVLLGDAAHTMPPHSGQGISQAVEDAACLAIVLRPFASSDSSDKLDGEQLEMAFKEYQSRRKPRVDAILTAAGKTGDQKREKTAWECFVRKWMMKLLMVLMPERMMDKVYRCQYSPEMFQ